MDINDIRAILTVVSFAAFVGIIWWAYSARQKQRFERAARAVLAEDDAPRDDARGGAK